MSETLLRVCFQAQPGIPFNINMLDTDFRPIVRAINNNYLLNPITNLYNLCQPLTQAQRNFLSNAFVNNNDIQGLCENTVAVVTYDDIEVQVGKPIRDLLNNHAVDLYEKVLKRAPYYNRHGRIEEYYNSLMENNGPSDTCPFCWIPPILDEFDDYREAYDHYLPKDQYPFTSVNFTNLAPMCHTCNSKYKLQKPVIFTVIGGNRRRAFYPFHTHQPEFILSINLISTDLANLQKADIQLTITESTIFQDETDTWLDVFGLIERYKGRCCKRGNEWVREINRLCRKMDVEDALDVERENKEETPWIDMNFLKYPFLLAYQAQGVI